MKLSGIIECAPLPLFHNNNKDNETVPEINAHMLDKLEYAILSPIPVQ